MWATDEQRKYAINLDNVTNVRVLRSSVRFYFGGDGDYLTVNNENLKFVKELPDWIRDRIDA